MPRVTGPDLEMRAAEQRVFSLGTRNVGIREWCGNPCGLKGCISWCYAHYIYHTGEEWFQTRKWGKQVNNVH